MSIKFSTKLFIPALTVMILLGAVFALTSSVHTVLAGTASDCASTGRSCWQGYFYNNYQMHGDNVLPSEGPPGPAGSAFPAQSGPVDNGDPRSLNNFINYIGSSLNCPNPSGQAGTGAAFIILTMLGYGPGTPKSTACTEFNRWSNMVTDYSAAGRINWNINYSYTINTLYQTSYDDDAFIPELNNNSPTLTLQTDPAIVFTNPNGTQYAIRRACANPIGKLNGLTQLPWTLTGTSSKSTSSVYPGQTVTFNQHVHNNGPVPADFQYGVRWQYFTGATPGAITTWPPSNQVETRFPVGADTVAWNTAPVTIPVNSSATKLCSWIAFTNPRGAGTGNGTGNTVCVNILHPTASCNISVQSTIAVGKTFTVSANVSYQDNAAARAVWNSGGRSYYAIPPTADSATDNAQPAPAANNLANNFVAAPIGAGNYTVSAGVTGSPMIGANSTCRAQITVGYQPFFSALGGDVEAGPGYGTSCTDGGATAGITGLNRNDGTAAQYYGAGSQLAALALGNVTSFASSMNLDASSSGVGPPGGLTLANTSPLSPTYGGRIGLGSNWCNQDYAANAAAYNGIVDKTVTLIAPLNKIDVYSLAISVGPGNHVFKYVGKSVNLIASQPLPLGTNVTILVQNGNVTVGSVANPQITYSSYNTLKDIPQFQLLVSGGNILIDRSVNTLHGVYVAEPKGGVGGTLYTCTLAGMPITGTTPATDYSTCNNPLTIYGAVSVAKLSLGRTHGNLFTSGPVTATPTEVFEFTPELWLSGWSQSSPTIGSGSAQSITSLPPIL